MTRRLVIGIGNPERGDDGAGREVARRLAVRCGDDRIETRECGGEATELMDAWAGADDVVLVDACRGAGPAGSIHSFDAGDVLHVATLRHASTHSMGVAAGIGLARALGSLPAHLVVWAIEAGASDEGEGLSPEVDRGVQQVVDLVMQHSGCEYDEVVVRAHRPASER